MWNNMGCKNICKKYMASKPSNKQSRYAEGQKRCSVCEIYIKWDGLCCPCCGYKLRFRPINTRLRRKITRPLYPRLWKINPELMLIKSEMIKD